ncbi:tripartite tricarboxylate transporter substrate binding protein [Siccirubricoccus sp. KC 17139]|uniref:Tripartite tricarboxylate transporter substrate binding protein n=1 Tax=Siccirubricoccus soli TaxID=2899147 RepID=A0ABT1D542_9PROT|nr:tripartite tricarboxylate transporter substrate binding protein [Siccirubricoccus soli]MCO6417041.1 tripartite tricarboxylate transporter substrate binding protein [Siccirubricoccus soli]MCP2683176.1 tripartite tricarboxylate transporter substrate binding protein [Siccirubricoccus soli]
MNFGRRALLALTLPALAHPAFAQGWPTRPIRLLVPYATGGGTDLLARALAEALRPALPQPVVVENRAGGAGVIGTELVARAEPDGHTLMAVVSTHVANRYFLPALPYDPLRDFTPVALLTRNTMVLAAGTGQPFADLPALLERAKAQPGRIGTGSTESLSSFIGQELARRAKVEMPDVQYRSGGQLMNDIVAGHLPVGWTSTASAMPHMQTGRVHLLAVSTATRTPFFPETPTVQEQGIPDFDLPGWVGLYGPSGLAAPVVERLYQALTRAFEDATLRQRFATMGIEPALGPGTALAAAAEREDKLWAAAAAAGHIQKQQ